MRLSPELLRGAQTSFAKLALSPQVIGAGLGAGIGALTAPKDENGVRQGRLGRALIGAGVGAGAGQLMAGSRVNPFQPFKDVTRTGKTIGQVPNVVDGMTYAKMRFHGSPLGTAFRAGPAAAASQVGRSVGAAADSMRGSAAVWGRDFHGVRANPVGAAADVVSQAASPLLNMAAHPIQTVARGAEHMGPIGQAMFVSSAAPGAVQDFRTTENQDGTRRGLAERSISAGGRVAVPLAFAAHGHQGNKVTSLLGGMVGHQLASPLLSRTGRAIDRVTAGRDVT